MAKRGSAVHVATTTRKVKGKTYTSHLLRRTYRDGAKVKHETVGNLSHLPPAAIDLVRRALRGEILVSADEAFAVERSLPHGHVAAVLGTLRKLELDRILASRPCRERELAIAMIVARILEPRSKLATARGLDGSTSLGEVLGLGQVDVDEMYAAMDWLVARQDRIEKGLARRRLADGSLVLYDLTSTYFEGRSCSLARLGYSRDRKQGKLQIEIGLLTDALGCPVAVRVFEGNVGDPATVSSQVQTLRQRFGLSHLVVVGDRGMLTEARIREDLSPKELQWITSLRAPAIRKLLEGGSLQMSLFDERDLAEITAPSFPGERLILCRNPLLREERARKRQELLAATEKELDQIVAATQRPNRPLRGREAIGLRVGRVVGKFRMAKHYHLEITDSSFRYRRNTELITAEASLDGVYVVRTNVPKERLDSQQAVQAYKDLSRVERAFRSLKSVDLKVRPIYHHLEPRVRAHVLLCMLAYYVEWHLRRALAPLLFDDEEPEAGRQRRPSVVAPARRSDAALGKVASKQTEEGLPVHSFHTLLADLATLCKNRIRSKINGGVAFDQLTIPTPLQREAFALLDLQIAM